MRIYTRETLPSKPDMKRPRDYYVRVARNYGFENQLLVFAERFGADDETVAPYVIGALEARYALKQAKP